jgi:hypothetical protein
MNYTKALFTFIAAFAGIVAAVLLLPPQPASSHGPANITTADVYSFDPMGEQVMGANARLVTNEAGATIQLKTSDLTPGDAVTVWWVIFNYPEACAAYPYAPCTVDDLMNNPGAVGAEVTYAAGNVVGGSGISNFAGHLSTGHTDQEWFGNGLTNPTGAEIHLVVRTHGEIIPGLVHDMISTFRGGCHDDHEINPDHPAYDDGVPGPNQCQDLQFTILQQ